MRTVNLLKKNLPTFSNSAFIVTCLKSNQDFIIKFMNQV